MIEYAFLALPLGFSGVPLYILAPDFYVMNHAVSLSTLGFCLLVIRIFDAFQDPLIGIISDRYRTKTFSIMSIGACILVVSIYMLFNGPILSPVSRFMTFMTLSVTAYSILTINLNAMGGLWCKQEKSQVKISSFREAFSLIGLLVAVSIPYSLEQIIPKNQVYEWFVWILLGFVVIGLMQFYSWHRQYATQLDGRRDAFSLNSLKFVPRLKKFFYIYFLSMFASSIPAALVIFFVRDLLGVGHYTGFFLLLYFLSAALFMPFWNYLSGIKGKYTAWLFSTLLASFTFIGAFFLTKGDVWQYGVVCFMSGVALGGDLVFPPAIVSDHIHDSHVKTASSYYGMLNLISKSALAFASALSFFILDYADFKAGGNNFSTSLIGLSVAYALIPCTLKIIAAFMMWQLCIQSNKGHLNENI